MRCLSILVATLMFCISCHSQSDSLNGEFRSNSNGLMYSDNDMKTLRFIVDSLNLRFKTCDLSKKVYSKPQTTIFAVSFESELDDLKKIIADLGKNIPPPELLLKYATYISSIDSSKTIIKSDSDYYLSGTPGNGYNSISLTDTKKFNSNNLKTKWTYSYSPKDKYSKEYSLDCFFFPSDFTSIQIPDNYAKLIQYVDCMIDTSAYIFLTKDYDRFSSFDKNENYSEVNNYINIAMKLKRKKKDDWEYDYISPDKVKYAKENLKSDKNFISLIETISSECNETKKSTDELEDLIGAFVSKETALNLKRHRRVMGMCSQDQSPRVHARNIAILAAEAHSWDIFLRAHLDILNDRFERITDGSYAYGGRKTYLKELEELNLNIVDLMLGLTLRAENVADNHYYGTIWRMGWALTESKEKEQFEQKVLVMIKDNSLDQFNRGLLFLLYKTYISYLPNSEKKEKIERLKNNITSFPGFIQPSINSLIYSVSNARR